MNVIQALILGITQGLTEFIPVSSSGHLVLMHRALGLGENGLAFDVALHLGTLMALIIYFHKDLWQLLLGLFGKNQLKRLAWLLVLATVPAVISGVLLESAAENGFRSVKLVSFNLIIAALFMLWAERVYQKRSTHTKLKDTNRNQALAMGVAQAIAVVPGISRSGSTITVGLFAGLDRVAATRFSFLLGIPITAGAILKVFSSNDAMNQFSQQSGVFIIGMVTAFVTGLFAIRFMLRYLAKHSLAVFAYYRIAVAAVAILLVTLR